MTHTAAKDACTCRLLSVERPVSRRGLMSPAAVYEYDTTGCVEHDPDADEPRPECSHCPPGCPQCWAPDCECYAHQDEPDRRVTSPGVGPVSPPGGTP